MSDKNKIQLNCKDWAKYAAAGVAATLAGTQSAEADITHIVIGSPTGDISIANSTVVQSFSSQLFIANAFDLTGGSGSAGVAVAALVGGSLAGFTSGFAYVSNLNSGDQVSAANFLGQSQQATLAYGYGYSGSQFINTGGFVGFRFDNGNGFQYGWARLSLASASPLNEYVLEELAFSDTAGEAVAAGQTSSIPEPGSLGLLALGAVGVLANRRRKN